VRAVRGEWQSGVGTLSWDNRTLRSNTTCTCPSQLELDPNHSPTARNINGQPSGDQPTSANHSPTFPCSLSFSILSDHLFFLLRCHATCPNALELSLLANGKVVSMSSPSIVTAPIRRRMPKRARIVATRPRKTAFLWSTKGNPSSSAKSVVRFFFHLLNTRVSSRSHLALRRTPSSRV
jgi:hypothetical protein